MQRLKTVTRHPACQICCRWENAWRDTVTKRMSLYANEGRTQGPRVLSDSRTEKNRGSQATDMKISFSRITKIGKFEERKFAKGYVKAPYFKTHT